MITGMGSINTNSSGLFWPEREQGEWIKRRDGPGRESKRAGRRERETRGGTTRDTLSQKRTVLSICKVCRTRKSAKGDEPDGWMDVPREGREGAEREREREEGRQARRSRRRMGGIKKKKVTQVACGWSPAA